MLEEFALPLPQTRTTLAAAEVDLPALVETYATTLFRVAHSLLRNRAEAEDVVQNTFLRVVEHQGKLAAVRDLRPWLIRITWHRSPVRARRHSRRHPGKPLTLGSLDIVGTDRHLDIEVMVEPLS